MMINLKDNSEKDKYILELFRTSPKEAFRLLFDAYHMKLCIYAVQLTDSFEMAEDIVQDFFIYFWEKKYYLKINQNLRYYLYLSLCGMRPSMLCRKTTCCLWKNSQALIWVFLKSL